MIDESKGNAGDLDNYVTVDGILIKQDFDHLILDASEIDKYTPLKSATMT